MISATANNFMLIMKGNQAPTNVTAPLLAFYAALAGAPSAAAPSAAARDDSSGKAAKKAADCRGTGQNKRGGCFYIAGNL